MPPRKDERAGNIKLLRRTGGTDKKPVGTWRVRLPLGRDQLTGTPRNLERRVTGTEADAWAMMEDLRRQPRAKAKALAPTTVTEMLDQYIEWLRTFKGREATTLAGYRAHASRVNQLIGDRRIGSMTRRDIGLLYRQLLKDGKSAATLRRYQAVLSGAFKWARREGLLLEDAALPTDGVEMPELVDYRAETVNVAGALAVMARARAVDPQLALALGLAVATGCRRGELCGLQWRDIDEELTWVPLPEGVEGPPSPVFVWRLRVRRSIASVPGRPWFVKTTTKTKQDRALALDSTTFAMLATERSQWAARTLADPLPDAFILADLAADSSGLVPHQPDWLTWGWRQHADALGVKARLHDLRHLHATALLEVGTPLTTVSRRLGHSKVSTTLDIYSHVTEGKDQEAADTIGRLMAKPAPKPSSTLPQ